MFLSVLNSMQRFYASHVLLYHSTYSQVPTELEEGLHNVHPEQLYRQIKWLKRRFQIVELDEFVQDPRPGRVAITFDDGYECVFTEAVPVLDTLEVPCTVFINGSSLYGKPFWRDKIRFLMNRWLVNDFLDYYRSVTGDDGHWLQAGNFYKATKNPCVNSRCMDEHVDRFLADRQINFSDISYCVRDRALVKRSRRVTIGNHSLDHYVLSSLSSDEQAAEIQKNEEIIRSLGVPVSQVFSIPFGGEGDFNEQTISLIHDLGYRGFLYSRNLLNLPGKPPRRFAKQGLRPAERYMVPTGFDSFQKRIFKLGVKTVKHRLTDWRT